MLWSPTGTASLAKCPYEQQRCRTPVWTALPNPWVSYLWLIFEHGLLLPRPRTDSCDLCFFTAPHSNLDWKTADWTASSSRPGPRCSGRDLAKAISEPCPCRPGSSCARSRLPRALSSGISDTGSALLPHRSECAGRAYAKRSTIAQGCNKKTWIEVNIWTQEKSRQESLFRPDRFVSLPQLPPYNTWTHIMLLNAVTVYIASVTKVPFMYCCPCCPCSSLL